MAKEMVTVSTQYVTAADIGKMLSDVGLAVSLELSYDEFQDFVSSGQMGPEPVMVYGTRYWLLREVRCPDRETWEQMEDQRASKGAR